MTAEAGLLQVILQLAVIIGAAKLGGTLFRRIGQPPVCGEIAAGLLLGPSLFGHFLPSIFHRLFDPSSAPFLTTFSQLGLILTMFLIGIEFDFGHLRHQGRAALAVSIAGFAAPFFLGLGLGRLMYGQLGLTGNPLHFSLFIAAALSITAMPVLGRIMIELNITRTRVGALTIAAAALDDAIGWICLGSITALVRSSFDAAKLALMIAATAAYLGFMVFLARPAVKKWGPRFLSAGSGDLTAGSLAAILILILISAALTSLIGILAILGGFMAGAILYDQRELCDGLRRRLGDFVTALFLPVFFAYTGLRTDSGSMTGARLWLFCGLMCLVAAAGKVGGCSLAARLSGLPAREAAIAGVLMNARGLTELIAANAGYDLGIVPKSVFFMLVTMALVTTFLATPLLRRLFREAPVGCGPGSRSGVILKNPGNEVL